MAQKQRLERMLITPQNRLAKNNNRNMLSKWYEPYLYMGPLIITLIALYLYPIIRSILMAFQNYKLTQMNRIYFNGLTNFRRLFMDKYLTTALSNSLFFTPLLVLVSIVAGLAIAYALNKRFHLRGLIQTIIFLPSAISGFVTGIGFRWIANGEYGVLNDLLVNVFSIVPSKLSFLSTPNLAILLVICATLWCGTPAFAIVLLAAMQNVPQDLYEAAELDGCNAWRRFFSITLPFIKPVVVMMILLKSIWAFNYLDIVNTVTAGGPGFKTMTLPMYMYTLGFTSLDFGRASALGLLIFCGLGTLCFAYMRLTKYESAGDF